jgi:hypothetical protein
MNSLLHLVVFTANILGSFNDPFEFDGNYGEEVNPIRDYVFEQVVSKEAIVSNLSVVEEEQFRDQLIADAIQRDLQHGPTLDQLIPLDLIEQFVKKQQELQNEGFSDVDLRNILSFLERYKDQKVFSFLRHNPSDLLSLDKILRDKASRDGRSFDLPILSSTEPLKGENALELKANLLESLFTKETLSQVKPPEKLQEAIAKLDPGYLQRYLGQGADNAELSIFITPAGQVFFYWLYQSLNLHLISQDEAMIAQINNVKKIFASTLGNPVERAGMFREKLIAAEASVVFTQESDAIVPQLLTENGLFHSVDSQNLADGTLVLLRGDAWEPLYEVIPIDDYEGYERGRLNVILARKTGTEERFLLASCHGNSTRAEDGRLQIFKIMEKFHQLKNLPENKGLQLVIGIDANTKTEEDVELLRHQLEELGLEATNMGPTTIKKRMVTAQHSKAGRFAVDEEDYVIVLKPANGGVFEMTHPTVGFREEKTDVTITLPNMDNPSDHYPVGATLYRISQSVD